MKRVFILALTMFLAISGYAQTIKLAGRTWKCGWDIQKYMTFNQNGTVTVKQSGSVSGRLGGVYCTVQTVQTWIGMKWKLYGDKLQCECIPLQISVNVNLLNEFSYSAAQKRSINAAIPALKQQLINKERQEWQSQIGDKLSYVIRDYSPKKFNLANANNGKLENILWRDEQNMTAAQKVAYNKEITEFEAEREAEMAKREAEKAEREAEKAKREAEKAKREAEEKAKREAEEKAKQEAEEAKRIAEFKKSIDNGVNLGLPSGTLWCVCNLGATSPEDYGDYFAWGETKGYKGGKSDFSSSNYFDTGAKDHTFKKYNNKDGLNELELVDDAAYVNLGPVWRIPSKMQFEELINSNYTTTKWTTQNGVVGYKITSKMAGYEGNSIFLPAAGYRYNSSLDGGGFYGGYWLRTLDKSGSYRVWFSSSDINAVIGNRFLGFTVRPVRSSE